MRLTVRDFSFIKDATHATTTGFIAQELYEVFPCGSRRRTATTASDPLGASSTPWSVDYGRITPLLAKSIQDLNFKLEDLATTTPEIAERPLHQPLLRFPLRPPHPVVRRRRKRHHRLLRETRAYAGNLHDAIGWDGGVRERGPTCRDPRRNKRRRSNRWIWRESWSVGKFIRRGRRRGGCWSSYHDRSCC